MIFLRKKKCSYSLRETGEHLRRRIPWCKKKRKRFLKKHKFTGAHLLSQTPLYLNKWRFSFLLRWMCDGKREFWKGLFLFFLYGRAVLIQIRRWRGGDRTTQYYILHFFRGDETEREREKGSDSSQLFSRGELLKGNTLHLFFQGEGLLRSHFRE